MRWAVKAGHYEEEEDHSACETVSLKVMAGRWASVSTTEG